MYNVFTKEINKIAFNKRMQSTDSIETSIETSSKDLVKKKRLFVIIQ